MASTMHTSLYLVRHGQTDWNKERRVQGWRGAPLNDTGRKEAHEAALRLLDVPFTRAYSSDLLRAQQTAEIIGKNFGVSVVSRFGLRERRYGMYEGTHESHYKKELAPKLAVFSELPPEEQWHFKYAKDIESNAEVYARLYPELREIARLHPGETVLVVSHGAAMRALLIGLSRSLKKPDLPQGRVHNAGYFRLTHWRGDIIGVDDFYNVE